MGFKLGKKSLEKLNGVHPDLVKVVKRAIELTEIDFSVGEGLRTLEKQKEYLAKGATTTLKSRHLTGHAVDLFAFVGKEVRWDEKCLGICPIVGDTIVTGKQIGRAHV